MLDEISAWQDSASPEEEFEFCERLCAHYEQASAEVRSEIRRAVAENENVRERLLYDSVGSVGPGGFLVEVAKRAVEHGDYSLYLRRALLAISITDGFCDSRDTLMWLAEQWRAVESKGVDPTPLYRQIGNISSRETLHEIGGPTSHMILQMLDESRREQLKWS